MCVGRQSLNALDIQYMDRCTDCFTRIFFFCTCGGAFFYSLDMVRELFTDECNSAIFDSVSLKRLQSLFISITD